jgi:hypothetical protein
MKITNNSPARQGFNTADGKVSLAPGETSADVSLTPKQAERLSRLPFIALDGQAGKGGKSGKGGNANADLTKALAEITTLKDRVAELELENEELKKQIPAPVAPEAKHRGAGSYSIMEGETELREKLTKEQADAFNALDVEGKAKWLADNPKAAA